MTTLQYNETVVDYNQYSNEWICAELKARAVHNLDLFWVAQRRIKESREAQCDCNHLLNQAWIENHKLKEEIKSLRGEK